MEFEITEFRTNKRSPKVLFVMADHLPAKVTSDNVFSVYLFFWINTRFKSCFQSERWPLGKLLPKSFFVVLICNFLKHQEDFKWCSPEIERPWSALFIIVNAIYWEQDFKVFTMRGQNFQTLKSLKFLWDLEHDLLEFTD